MTSEKRARDTKRAARRLKVHVKVSIDVRSALRLKEATSAESITARNWYGSVTKAKIIILDVASSGALATLRGNFMTRK